MMRRFLTGGLMLLALCAHVLGGDPPATTKPAPHAGLERLKKLAGTWVGLVKGKDGKETEQVVSVIKVIGGGSTVHETIFPGTPMEMVSVYHLDKGELVMTHYCVLGNQPRMKADPKSPEGKIVWKFDGGSNIDVNKDKHMHAATLTFIDADTIEINGEGWENGKPMKECCGVMKLTRKK